MASPSFINNLNNYNNQIEGAVVNGFPPSGKNLSFSGCDIRATVRATDQTGKTALKTLGNIATLSYSIHREKFPVRTLGTTFPKAFTRGPRTIAGTLIFNVFDRYALWDIQDVRSRLDVGFNENAHALLGDQIAPFEISCNFMNEQGVVSTLSLLGVELVDEGQVMSINDIYIESTHSFVAADIMIMTPVNLPNPTAQQMTAPNTSFYFDSSSQTVQSFNSVLSGPNPLKP
jgi:hypothetical protein